jgi:threonine dehydrogenase-like Zn-dependent dehydrogenase
VRQDRTTLPSTPFLNCPTRREGEGADVVIDCVGMEASPGHGQGGLVSAVKEKVMPAERTYVLDQAIRAVRPCGVVSVPGVYGGPVSVDMGSIVQKGLRLCSGQTHVKRYLEPLTKLIQEKKVAARPVPRSLVEPKLVAETSYLTWTANTGTTKRETR